ncbi:hypothetical protein I302_101411 [Kwoniella bestiolae CBS 10118]|uniref:Uncharacterized protein n=1 Tax=Kwoniella bestiolae CBS 10118 TaxID=1296100 RepID=A0A1B9GC70_9TREE|nr:hypothetical protein I302_00092 [Kwoniella bestiolae CBS 10118]OCF28604.1 hypothetical protein I302_00092 [Kwoniella bestiolae CBS 10118]
MSQFEHPPDDVERPRYDSAFQKIDVIKAFIRINPPYTLKRKIPEIGPQSQYRHNSSSSTIPGQGMDTATPELERDPHDYLDPKYKAKWKHTTSLLSWSSPTEGESAYIGSMAEEGDAQMVATALLLLRVRQSLIRLEYDYAGKKLRLMYIRDTPQVRTCQFASSSRPRSV